MTRFNADISAVAGLRRRLDDVGASASAAADRLKAQAAELEVSSDQGSSPTAPTGRM